MSKSGSGTSKRSWPAALYWWIDAVGSFQVFLKPSIRIGQAGNKDNDVAIMADISTCHVEIHREASSLRLVANAPTTVNGKPVESAALQNKDVIRMRSVEMTCFQPVEWSPTSRLEITSNHRLPLAMDAVVMLSEICILGPKADAHIQTDWELPVYISWHRQGYWIRCAAPLTIDGHDVGNFAPLSPSCEVGTPWGDFRWEPASDGLFEKAKR